MVVCAFVASLLTHDAVHECSEQVGVHLALDASDNRHRLAQPRIARRKVRDLRFAVFEVARFPLHAVPFRRSTQYSEDAEASQGTLSPEKRGIALENEAFGRQRAPYQPTRAAPPPGRATSEPPTKQRLE